MSPLVAFVGLPLDGPVDADEAALGRLAERRRVDVHAAQAADPSPTTRNPDDDGRISSWP